MQEYQGVPMEKEHKKMHSPVINQTKSINKLTTHYVPARFPSMRIYW